MQCAARVNTGSFKQPSFRQCRAIATDGILCPVHIKKMIYGKITDACPAHFMHQKGKKNKDEEGGKEHCKRRKHQPHQEDEAPVDAATIENRKAYWSQFRIKGIASSSSGHADRPMPQEHQMQEHEADEDAKQDGTECASGAGIDQPVKGPEAEQHAEDLEKEADAYEATKAKNTQRVREWRQRVKAEKAASMREQLIEAHGQEDAQAILAHRAKTAERVRAWRAKQQ